MLNIKERASEIRDNHKRGLILLGISWKILATLIMIEKCNWPKDMSTPKNQVENIK